MAHHEVPLRLALEVVEPTPSALPPDLQAERNRTGSPDLSAETHRSSLRRFLDWTTGMRDPLAAGGVSRTSSCTGDRA